MMHSYSPTARRSLRVGALAILGALTLSVGCGFETKTDPRPPERVRAIFDPDTSTVPLPNSAALEADGTLPKLDAPKDTAQAAFYSWLDDLSGWLPETGIVFPFDGALDPASVTPDAFVLVEIDANDNLTKLDIASVEYVEVTKEMTPLKSQVTVVPAAPLKPGMRYGAIALKDLKGANGEAVTEAAGIFFGLNNGPLIVDGRVTVPQLASDPDTALRLETAVRSTLAPLVKGLDGLGVERDDIASATVWGTTTDTFTVLDPATSTIPLPNTLALDEGEDGLPTFPLAALPTLIQYKADVAAAEADGTAPPARNSQIVFEEYLDQLHGWTNSAALLPVELPLTGAVDPATLTDDSVQLWILLPDGTPQRVEGVPYKYVKVDADAEAGTPATHKIAFELQEDLALNTDYFAFVTRDVKAEDGSELLPPAALLLAMQPGALVDAEGNSQVSELDDATAQRAAGVQALLAPVMAAIEAETGNDFEDLASVWNWYTWRDPFIVFDPLSGDIPFPNAFLIDAGDDADDGTADLPLPANADPLTESIFNEVNSRDGFSTLGDGWVSVSGELDPATVTYFEKGQTGAERGSVVMAQRVGALPTVIPPEKISIEYRPDYSKIMIRPEEPLRADTLQVGVLTNRIKGTNGLLAKPTPIFVMLASEYPLYDMASGESLVAQLPVAAAPALEGARQQYAALFVGAQVATKDTRETIVGAFAFTTDDPAEPLQQIRAQVMAKLDADGIPAASRSCETDAGRTCADDLLNNSDGSSDTYTGVFRNNLDRDFSSIAQVQWAGEFETLKFLADDGSINDYGSLGTDIVPISLYVPKTVAGVCEPPFRVAIAQHGLGSARLISGLGIAPTFAHEDNCLAVVVADSLLHGGRAADATTLHPESYSDTSGDGFLGVNFVQSKNNFIQAVVDLIILNQLIRAGGLEGLVDNTTSTGIAPMFDTSEAAIIGTSLGGIFATDLLAIDPDITVGVLAVAPGKLTYYLTLPSRLGADVLAPLVALGIEPGTFAFEQLISLVQWVADVIDPANFAARAVGENTLSVLSYDPGTDTYTEQGKVPEIEPLAIMALNDDVAPNKSTEQLAKLLGLDLTKSTYEARHAFVNEQDRAHEDYVEAQCARLQAAFFIRESLKDADATIPAALTAQTCVSNLPE